jgi:Transmembrane protein 138
MEQKSYSSANYSKLVAMVFFLCADLALNGTLDYDLFNNAYDTKSGSNLLLGLLGLQIVIQIAIFLILFIAMADTFLFRVGLLGLLIRKFKMVLLMHPVYIFITALTGSFRVRHFGNGDTVYTIWQNTSFIQLSTAQKIRKLSLITLEPATKTACLRNPWISSLSELIDRNHHSDLSPRSRSFIVAIPYYLLNLRAVMKLSDPSYYTGDTWVALVRQVSVIISPGRHLPSDA